MLASQPTSFDMVIPVCDADGTYKAIQCYNHKVFGKWCWCVDKLGLEIIGTRSANDSLTEEHCLEMRKVNNTNDYWTAFYNKPTQRPRPPVVARVKPVRPLKGKKTIRRVIPKLVSRNSFAIMNLHGSYGAFM